jgi:hypothetical protein
MTERIEVGRIRMDSVNVSDLWNRLADMMLIYGVDLDFGIDGPFMVLTGPADASPKTGTVLNDNSRRYVLLHLLEYLTGKNRP